ncbi:hypothetical protein AOL_s00083g39 [Orbilia oligospora ATCC 24927]|uniref:HNH nuclease domain-containing protein n=1 Tax=Arthrobotrys oligospora (strain ATCC 24927 / CBS 115.81 / DSM 1491) TaxID=756982 RepID=G1XGA9_ARTOA|nr:hypothetical protein AOL_s00083g39 [Orbilia oligospora ATCC 24927]EGX47827.1 hypothetical protein AOL_s00083g39 [Orbilia oligospora ATCC 24927]
MSDLPAIGEASKPKPSVEEPIYRGSRYYDSKLNDFHFLDGHNNEVGRSEQHGNLTWDEIMEWFTLVYPNLKKGTFKVYRCPDANPMDLVKTISRLGEPIDLVKEKDVVFQGNSWYVILGLNKEYIKVEHTRHIPGLRVAPSTSVPTDPRCEAKRKPQLRYYWETVRSRDRKCVLTGKNMKQSKNGRPGAQLVCCPIYPPELRSEWLAKGWPRRITDVSEEVVIGKEKLCSIQNSILMESRFSSAFTMNKFSINPKRGYKITVFRNEDYSYTLDGKHALIAAVNTRTFKDNRVSDELLYNHWKESVIINMTGRQKCDLLPTYPNFRGMCTSTFDARTKLATEIYLAKALVLDIDRCEQPTMYDIMEAEFAARGFSGYTDDDWWTEI